MLSHRKLVGSLSACATLLLILVSVERTEGQTPSHLWSKSFGGTSVDTGYAIAVDASQNVYITGEFINTVDFGGGTLTSGGASDVFLAKFDSNGTHVWSKRFGDSASQSGRGVAVDGAGNVVICGLVQGTIDFGGGPLMSAGFVDTFVAKFNSTGAHVASRIFGGPNNDLAYAVAVDSLNDVIVVGDFRTQIDFGNGPLLSAGGADIFVAKLDAGLATVWGKAIGGTADESAYSAGVDSSGNIVLTGPYSGTVDFGGGPLTAAGGSDAYLLRVNSGGNFTWVKSFGDAQAQDGRAVVVDPVGNVTTTGTFWGSVDLGGGPLVSAGNADIYLARFDPSGAHFWSKRFGSMSVDAAAGVAIDGNSHVSITGSFRNAIDFGGGTLTAVGSDDIYCASFDANGVHLCSTKAGSAVADSGEAMTVDTLGNTLVIGRFANSVDFGGGALTSNGSSDIFLVKYGVCNPPPVDSDGDGVDDAEDVCPNTPTTLPVDCLGRPLRDCNLDCLVDGADVQCIADEIINQ